MHTEVRKRRKSLIVKYLTRENYAHGGEREKGE